MREIKFRGKRVSDGEWVYGLPSCSFDGEISEIEYWNEEVSLPDFDEVIPKTIGQYTGLKDKNGKEIYEGDIVEFEDIGEDGYEYKEAYDFINRAVVVWGKGRFVLDCFGDDNSGVIDDMNNHPEDFYNMFEHYAEVIGNIHDNPELLEVV